MASRYFQESSGGQEIKPGQISENLRKALGLQRNKLPIWIYRMRALGYPPGWLKKARVSSLDIFDDKDAASQSNKRKSSDGETSVIDATYDPEKFIVYPGFNAPIPEGCVDLYYQLGMPPMLPHQQLDYARQHMKFSEPLKPKRPRLDQGDKNESDEESDQDKDESKHQDEEGGDSDEEVREVDNSKHQSDSDSDEVKILENDEEGEICERSQRVKRSSSKKSNISLISENANAQEYCSEINIDKDVSPKHKYIRRSLNDSEEFKYDATKTNSNLSDKQVDSDESKSDQKEIKDSSESTETEKDKNSSFLNESLNSSKISQLKMISAGSPLPRSHSKPSLDKFSEGMGELLYFQNLPESTGMFDRMRNVLKRVRKHLVKR